MMQYKMFIYQIMQRPLINITLKNYVNKNIFSLNIYRLYCDNNVQSGNDKVTTVTAKYEIFKDENASIIFDVDEEKFLHKKQVQQKKKEDSYLDINFKRGIQGVFDIEDLVELLKKDKGQDIFVVRVPPLLNYVDYLVITTVKSKRHLIGIAELVRKVYKKKRNESDSIPRLEGENSHDWAALDLGNIALHIMSPKARDKYDLETLWSLGAKFDEKLETTKEDPLQEILKKYKINLDDFQPAG